MATSTTTTFQPFELEKALGGASVGFEVNESPCCVLNFKKSDSVYKDKAYEGISQDGEHCYFDYQGKCTDGRQLKMIVSRIEVTSGTAASRGDSDTQLDINSLQPREDFAKAALIGLLQNEENPATLDDAKISLYCSVAFKMAAGMMNTAADYRDMAGGEEPAQAEVNTSELTSNSDKLLSNISDYLKGIKENLGSNRDWSLALKGLNDKLTLIIDTNTNELKVSGGSGLQWSSSNKETTFANIGDIVVFNKDATPKSTRITVADFISQLVSNAAFKTAIEGIITSKVKPESLL